VCNIHTVHYLAAAACDVADGIRSHFPRRFNSTPAAR